MAESLTINENKGTEEFSRQNNPEYFEPNQSNNPIMEKNNLESIVGPNNDYNSFQKDNVNINDYGATLSQPEGLMSHATVAGTRFLNNLGEKVSKAYDKVKGISPKAAKKAGLTIATLALAGALATGCGGVTPGPPGPTPPGPPQKIDIPAGFDKAYFEEICFSTEYGPSSHPIYRWVEDPKIYLINPPTEEKREICENKMDELAKFTNYVLSPKIVDDINSANITVEWCDLNGIPLQQVGSGSFNQNKGIIYQAEILLFKGLDSILTKHNFLEEIGGCLGVTNDSYKYLDSIFYQGANQTTSFTKEDLAVGNVLYQLEPGTTFTEFDKIVEESLK